MGLDAMRLRKWTSGWGLKFDCRLKRRGFEKCKIISEIWRTWQKLEYRQRAAPWEDRALCTPDDDNDKTWEGRALCTPEFRFLTHINQLSKLEPQQRAFPIYMRKEERQRHFQTWLRVDSRDWSPLKWRTSWEQHLLDILILKYLWNENESLKFNFVTFTLNTLRILITRTSLKTLPTRPTTIVSFTLQLFSGLAQILYRVSPP